MINILDIGIILILLMFMIVGWKNGGIQELVSFVGIIIIFIISYNLKGIIGNIFCTLLPFIKFSGSLSGLTVINIFLYQAIAFLLVFSILLGLYTILMSISKTIQKIVHLTIILWLPSKLLGAFVGFIKAWIILFVLLTVLIVPLKDKQILEESKMVNIIMYKTPVLRQITSPFTSAIEEITGLTIKTAKQENTPEEANKEAIDIMLKYNIVDKRLIEKKKKKGKIDNIGNIDNILNRY